MSAITYNLERINAEADLLAIIGKDTHLTKKGSGPNGLEYSGPCPICHAAKTDGFVVQPERKPYPAYFCRKHSGPAVHSAVDYVAERRGYDLKHLTRGQIDEIVDHLVGDAAPTLAGPREPKAQPVRDLRLPPAQAWQAAARAYIQYAEAQLWSEAGEAALAYLRNERGLRDETIKGARLGYNPRGMYRPAAKWGSPNGKAEDLYLRAGIVIPWIIGGEVWAINTRQMGDVNPKDRYRRVRGSRAAIYNADALETASVALYVEGELDCLLAQQEAGGRLAVVSLGSGSGIPDRALWAYHFLKPNLTMFLPDNDEAGWETAQRFANENLTRFLAFIGLPDSSKDLGDYFRAGGNVKAWIANLLETHDPVYCDISALAESLGATIREV